jgi:NADPH-dependent curcumin reductase CurA
MHARMPICGMISLYNATGPSPGPNNMTNIIGRRIKIQGFIVSDFGATYPEFVKEMAGWIASGQIKYEETVMNGVEKAVDAFLALFSGGNTGKMLVKLG